VAYLDVDVHSSAADQGTLAIDTNTDASSITNVAADGLCHSQDAHARPSAVSHITTAGSTASGASHGTSVRSTEERP